MMDSKDEQGERQGKLAKLSGLQTELARALESLHNEAPNSTNDNNRLQLDISRMQEEVNDLKKDLGI